MTTLINTFSSKCNVIALSVAFIFFIKFANWLSACHDDNWKSCILNGERLSCPAPKVDHLMMLDVNKWHDVMQYLGHSSVLLTFFTSNKLRNSEMEYVINRL